MDSLQLSVMEGCTALRLLLTFEPQRCRCARLFPDTPHSSTFGGGCAVLSTICRLPGGPRPGMDLRYGTQGFSDNSTAHRDPPAALGAYLLPWSHAWKTCTRFQLSTQVHRYTPKLTSTALDWSRWRWMKPTSTSLASSKSSRSHVTVKSTTRRTCTVRAVRHVKVETAAPANTSLP